MIHLPSGVKENRQNLFDSLFFFYVIDLHHLYTSTFFFALGVVEFDDVPVVSGSYPVITVLSICGIQRKISKKTRSIHDIGCRDNTYK